MENLFLGIELGSTRIKSVLLDGNYNVIASGGYNWENRFENGYFTYPLSQVKEGLQSSCAALSRDYFNKTGEKLKKADAIGVSAMMHGYLPFDKDGKQLAEFRTWRNTITGEAAEKLTSLFGFNIPQRWSIAHLYQAILNGEEHVKDIAYLTTLAGYLHWQLTGEKIMGVGEASGMFPIDSSACDFDEGMVQKFKDLTGIDLRSILPKVLSAGESGGTLTEAGARFLDPSGTLQAGIPVAPCEGDAGTGMAATNSVRVRTGNVSAGTSD
ncbi:MAG: ATPase, partial [Clostridia bacterium]|nr:ATPase [Clostridia bacterium]